MPLTVDHDFHDAALEMVTRIMVLIPQKHLEDTAAKMYEAYTAEDTERENELLERHNALRLASYDLGRAMNRYGSQVL